MLFLSSLNAMQKYRIHILTFIIPFLFLQNGIAQIVASSNAGCAPLTVAFTAPAGMTSYYWDFDNGGSSTDANPSGVIFATPKNPYTVTLRACKTCPVLHTTSIAVFPKPTVTMSEIKGCPPLNATLNPAISLPSGVSITSLKYIYGDGASQTKTPPNLTPSNHTYTTANKNYTVSFEMITSPTNAGCDHTVTIPDVVKTSDLLINYILATPQALCTVPASVSFSHNIVSARPIVSYQWSFGDGNTSTSSNPTHTYTAFQTYTVTLKVKDDYGCEKTATTSVIVKENDMTKILSVDTACVNLFISLDIDGNAGLETRWQMHNGAIVLARPAFDRFTSEGWKTIEVTSFYPNYECPKSVTKQIYAIDPKIKYTIVPRPLCNKKNTFTLTCTNPELFEEITWEVYQLTDAGVPVFKQVLTTGFNPTMTYTIPDLDTITWKYNRLAVGIKAKTRFGCYVSLIDTNFISPLIAHVVPTVTRGCLPLKVGFYDKTLRYRKDTLVEWKLIFGDGNEQVLTSFNDTFFYNYTSRGIYDMRMVVKNQYGCIDTTYVTKIEVGSSQSPDFTISPVGGNVCGSDPNASITLTSTLSPTLADYTRFWVEGFVCTNTNTLTYKPTQKTGTFPIKMEVSDRGCISQTIKNITIKGPMAKAVDTQYCDTPTKVRFTNLSEDATSYIWDFGDGNTSTDQQPTKYYSTDGNYTAKLIAYNSSNGCPPDTFKLPIKVQTPKVTFAKDTFLFCHTQTSQIISTPLSNVSGYINDGINTGFIWEFTDARPPARTFSPTFNLDIHYKIIDTVYLRVRNFMNCIATDTAIYLVDSISEATTVQPTLICANDTVRFNSNISALTQFTDTLWTFTSGKTSKQKDTFYIYPYLSKTIDSFSTNFYLKTRANCIVNIPKTLYVKKLKLTLSPTSNNLCLKSSTIPLDLSATTAPPYITKISWLRPDMTLTTGATTQYNFTAPGSYTFRTYAVDSNNTNCKDTMVSNITVHPRPSLQILTDKDTLPVLCHPANIELKYKDLNTTNIISKEWAVFDPQDTTTYGSINTVAKELVKGLNRVQLIARTPYCTDTAIRDLIVRFPSGDMTIDKTTICKGDSITFYIKNLIDVTDYSIDFGDGSIASNEDTITHQYNYVPLGGKTVAKAIFTANGSICVGKPFDTTINIHEVYAKFGLDFNADTAICYRAVHIKDSSLGASNYRWEFGDGSTGTMKEPGFRTFPVANTYIIKLFIESSTYGCKDSFKDTLLLKPLPKALTFSDTICRGDSSKIYQLESQSNIVYTWKPSGRYLNSLKDSVIYKPDTNLTFTLRLYDTLTRCSHSDTAYIKVVQPAPPSRLDTILAPGADVLLPFSPIKDYIYTWSKDSFLSCTDCENPIAKYILKPITYRVYFRDKLKNCFYDSSIFTIDVYPDILVNAPTAFTPNGDGNNDIFYARGFGIKRLVSFKIFNRQGQLLFYSTREEDGWDGKYKDEPQNSDTYFYTIEGESYIPDKVVVKEGNFLLLR